MATDTYKKQREVITLESSSSFVTGGHDKY